VTLGGTLERWQEEIKWAEDSAANTKIGREKNQAALASRHSNPGELSDKKNITGR
jgi:hypothetical protein